jgi:hypothetical protein
MRRRRWAKRQCGISATILIGSKGVPIMRPILATRGVLFVVLLSAVSALAQPSLNQQVVGAGGRPGSSTSYRLNCTVGQVAIGLVASPSYTLQAGFWNGPRTALTDAPGADAPAARRWELEQNSPNPFNPLTTFKYSLPSAQHVRLAIYDLRGRLVRRLVDEKQDAGAHQTRWDGRDESGLEAASGVYLFKLSSAEGVLTKKMLLAR